MSTRIILLFYEILNGCEEINWNRFIMNKLQATSLLQICLHSDKLNKVCIFIHHQISGVEIWLPFSYSRIFSLNTICVFRFHR